jgi:signal transduction histidine kinase
MTSKVAGDQVSLRRERLEQAHHELRTALTILMASGELLRRETEHNMAAPHRDVARARLKDMDEATSRLLRLAVTIRVWHDNERIIE